MRSSRIAVALLALALAGCQTSAGSGLVTPQLPPLPTGATAQCTRPAAKLGDDLGVLAARWKATAVCEGGKRASLIAFYGDLRGRLGGK
jgi:hypothetical protein